jgi:serine/threonine-protein kinase
MLFGFIGLCAIGAFAVILTPFYIQNEDWRYLIAVWLLAGLAGGFTVLLRSRLRLSLRALRVLELAVIGFLVAYMTQDQCFTLFDQRFGAVFAKLGQRPIILHLRPLWFQHEPVDRSYSLQFWLMWAFSGWNVLAWVLLLVIYGLFIPNTWKRATLVICGVASIPILLLGAVCLVDPEVNGLQAGVLMLATTLTVAFAAGIAIFGAHRIDSLRRDVAAARRLGQYQLKELLGVGGMGEVYRAEHVLLRRPCAIKLIRPERSGDSRNLLRFQREVQATATLTNWHTVEIYDYGHAEDGTFYYVMEYLPGLTLEQLVSRDGPLSPEQTIHFLRQICAALREAHAIGLIHRDIKPGNIIVGERGGLPDVAKLLDFGLVRATKFDSNDAKLTQTGSLVGTPAYMSPEQARDDENLTERSDIYSLGAVAYFLLTGRPPFVAKTAVQVLAAHLHEYVKPLTDIRSDVPADLETVILHCLEKDPQRRFPCVGDLDEALSRCDCSRTN